MPRYYGVIAVAITYTLVGSRVGSDYRRPEMQFEQTWLQAEDPRVRVEPSGKVMDNSEWWKAFNDPVLDRLIETAFEQNYSLQLAGCDRLIVERLVGLQVAGSMNEKE